MKHTLYNGSLGIFAIGSAIAVAAPLASFDSLSTTYAADASFDIAFSSSAEITTERTVLMDGEPVEGRGGGRGPTERTQEFKLTHTDKFIAVGEGAPTKVERTFDDVSASMSMERRGEPMDIEMESPLPGVKLILELEDDEVVAKVDGDETVDEKMLEGHKMVFALDALLPSEDLGDSTTWEISADSFRTALQIDAASNLLTAPERDDAGQGEGRRGGRGRGRQVGNPLARAFGETLDWTIEAKLTDKTEEADGLQCRVIEIKAEVEGDLPAPEGRRGGRRDRSVGLQQERGQGSRTSELTGSFEGKLLWSMDTSRPVSFELTGELERSDNTTRESERGNFEMSSLTTTSVEISSSIAKATAKSDD